MKFPWSHSSLLEVLKSDSKLHHKCDKVCEDIASHKLDISEFIEELGPALTHDETNFRVQATLLLSTVLKNLPADLLSEDQLGFLVTFYCDRMKDHHFVIPAILEGLVALASMNNLPKEAACKLLIALFANIPCQSQNKDDRAKYFAIIKTLSSKRPDELKALQADFVYGVVGAIDGERDPRNLIFLFDFMPQFLQQFPLFHLAEEMFEVFACYFPIDFHPNQNDPEAITRDMLAAKLENCLCGSKEFAEHCITLLLEKLESELNIAKLDSLRLLLKCSQTFAVANIDKQLGDIWKALKLEILPGSGNKEVYDLALTCTKQLIVACQEEGAVCEHFLTTISAALLGNIADVSSKLFESSIKVAVTCSAASPLAALFMFNRLTPLILSQLQIDSTSAQQRVLLIDALQQILQTCKQNNVLQQLDLDLAGAAQKQFIQILVQENDASELKRIALSSVTHIPEIVVDENRFVVYTTIIHILLSSDNERLNVEECLYQFAIHYPNEVMNVIIDKLVAKNYDSITSSTERIFNSLAHLVALQIMQEKILQFLLGFVFGEPLREHVAILALKTLESVLQEPDVGTIAEQLAEQYHILDKFQEQVHRDGSVFSSDYLYSMATVMKAVMKQLCIEKQKSLALKHLASMDLTKLNDLYLTSGFVGYLDESIAIEDHFENLVSDLTKLSLESDDENIKTLCAHLLCSLFNRMPDDEHHRGVLRKLLIHLKEEVKKHNKKAVIILAWIGKGLIARGHPVAGEIVDDVADLLDHPTLCHIAALAFEVLSVEFPHLHLPLIKNLFKQKLVVLVMKKLEQSAERYAESHLRALIYVFKISPHLVLKMNIEKVGPILLKCLMLTNDNALVTTLTIILHFIREESQFFRDHLQTLLPHLLKLCTFEKSMKVRCKALECLLYATKYPPFLLLPFKQDMLQGLQTALDDQKRLVRNAAVAARLQWFLIGTGESNKPEN